MDLSSLRSLHGRKLNRVFPRVKSAIARRANPLKKLFECLRGGLIQEAAENFEVLIAELKGRSITCCGRSITCRGRSSATLELLMILSRNMDLLCRSQPPIWGQKQKGKKGEKIRKKRKGGGWPRTKQLTASVGLEPRL